MGALITIPDLSLLEKKVLLVFSKVYIIYEEAELNTQDIQMAILEDDNIKHSQRSINMAIKSLHNKKYLHLYKKRPKLYKANMENI